VRERERERERQTKREGARERMIGFEIVEFIQWEIIKN
jgi:hypothetical protein